MLQVVEDLVYHQQLKNKQYFYYLHQKLLENNRFDLFAIASFHFSYVVVFYQDA